MFRSRNVKNVAHAKNFYKNILRNRNINDIIILRGRYKGVIKITIKLDVKTFEYYQKKHELKETECAEGMGISPSQLWKIKKGVHDPGRDFIAGALKVFREASFDELFFLPGVSRVRNKMQNDNSSPKSA